MTNEACDPRAAEADNRRRRAADRDEETAGPPGGGGSHRPAARKERRETPFQFSIRELFGLVTLAAVALGILALFPRPYAAGLAGLVVLASLLVIIALQPTRPMVMITWWTMFLVYLLLTLSAILVPIAGP